MNKQLITGVLSVAVLLSFAGVALADTMMNDSMHGNAMPSSMMMMHPPAPMVLTVTTSGHGLLRGVVESVATSSLTVAAWGGTWTVNVSGTTDIVSGTLSSMDISSIAVGDYVGSSGMISEDSPMITADVLRDWSKQAGTMMHSDNMMQSTTSGAMMH